MEKAPGLVQEAENILKSQILSVRRTNKVYA